MAPSPAHATFLQTRHFASLDGLRAIAILAVLWHHCTPKHAADLQWHWLDRGFLGVDLFFGISGFLIVTLLLRERDRNPAGIDLRAFYVRRTLRIVPLQYATTLGILLLARGNSAPAVWHDVPYALTYTSNFVTMQSMLAITWSLAAEEQFYLLWPWLEKFAGRWLRAWLAILLLASVAITLGINHCGLLASWPGFFGQTTFAPILLGAALAHALHHPGGYACLAGLCRSRAAAPVALLATLGATIAWPAPLAGAGQLLVQTLMVWWIACCVYREDHGLRWLLTTPALVRIGVVSYGMYLMHHPCRHLVVSLVGDESVRGGWPALAGMLALTWALAELSFRTFERFFLSLKQRWSR
jgi:peptidoglycan/LPS O-acetylase OafA/YrhL